MVRGSKGLVPRVNTVRANAVVARRGSTISAMSGSEGTYPGSTETRATANSATENSNAGSSARGTPSIDVESRTMESDNEVKILSNVESVDEGPPSSKA